MALDTQSCIARSFESVLPPEFNGLTFVGFAARLEQEPDPPLGLIDEVFKNARGGYVAILITNFVASAHGFDELLVVGHQFPQHVGRDTKLSSLSSMPCSLEI